MTQSVDASRASEGPRTPSTTLAGRRRRRRNTTAENVAITAAAAACAAAAALWSDAAPTGLVAIDAGERALVAVLMVLAGSRARRWTLVLGAGVTAVAAVGPARIGALVAVGLIVVMVLLDRRSRVVDSVVGGAIGVAALSLEVGGFVGLDTVVGVAAAVPVLLSAYRYSSRSARRRWRRVGVALLVAAVVATLAAALAAALAREDLTIAVRSTEAGVDAAGDGDGATAARSFAEAEAAFDAADSTVGAWWASIARAVPVVGVNLEAVQDSVSIGAELSAAASAVAEQVDFDAVQQLDGGVDLAALSAFEVPVSRAASATDDAVEVLAAVDSPWLVPPVADRIDELSGRVDELQQQTELADLGVRLGPPMLGADGPRRYLVLLGNPAELRDVGGHLGNWAELVVEDGRFELVDVGGPMELSMPASQASQWVREELPTSLQVLKPAEFPQNWGGDPDSRTMARLASEQFELRMGRPVDGVVYADTAAFAAFLQLSGPVDVGRLPEPFQLSTDNAEQFLTRDQFLRFEREVDADAAVTAAIEDVFTRLTTSELPGPERLGNLFSPLVQSGHMTLESNHDEDAPLVERLGLDRAVTVPEGGDLLAVLQRNAGPNKIDSFLRRSTDVELQWNPATGDVRSVVTVTLHNDAPAEGFNRLVLGNDAAAPFGSNVTDVAVLTPFILQSVSVDGSIVAAQPLLEDQYWRHTARVTVPPGGTRTVRFEMFGQVEPGPDYRLAFVGQPIMGDNTLDVTMLPVGGPAELTQVSGADAGSGTRGVDAGVDSVFSWQPAKQN